MSLFRKKTKFFANGLIAYETPLMGIPMRVPNKFVAPRKIDFRDMCLKTSDQAETPHCVGYSVAGYIEVHNWKKNHYPEQIDGDLIYHEAKKIDGFEEQGTYIRYGINAARNLELIDGQMLYVNKGIDAIKFAIHEFSVCVGGFIVTDEWNLVGKNGIIPNKGSSATPIGGHAVLICGYDNNGVYIQNSWSPEWGLHGFAFLSWDLFLKQFQYGAVIQ